MKSVAIVSVLVLWGLAIYFFISQNHSDPEIHQNQTVELDLTESAINETDDLFSDDISYPSPVIELQQTLAHGIQNLDAPELPLVQGDLRDFSEKNMPDDIPPPEELQKLNQELERLESLMESSTN
ncbi:conserved hypothetical protein [Vibrio nigripulchritudo SFn27]|uniref:Uncharacterized protein n=1 Tax=Vibrio nigripulchritudo TaxID=28173 RepID=U4KEY7_9VIBR|nr:hypothetical protein [Vibrio nigripulchritudo]CCN84068.1 conserved hypothetical protein [Vibrio nigripulchritudo BLFn1]CCN89262.1 conserved hypothetical protein [Vibrio nigripulchritudo SFn27]CCN93084.1 conserved hypothetical protein [Vibrio nigripulchritudo ENn2]CCO40386.1 conserved hypothetical protein [Vibrio nigripulchritudo SFn135]CCO55673.1 conserved hypothetical protein [Vibrio nigripulchritudo Wn13]